MWSTALLVAEEDQMSNQLLVLCHLPLAIQPQHHQQPRMNVNKQLSSSATSHGSRDNILSGGGGGSSTSGNSNLGGSGGATVQSQPQQQSPMSQSMPTTILNIEENRVTIQVPGVQSSNVQPRTSQHPTVVKQSSAEKEDD